MDIVFYHPIRCHNIQLNTWMYDFLFYYFAQSIDFLFRWPAQFNCFTISIDEHFWQTEKKNCHTVTLNEYAKFDKEWKCFLKSALFWQQFLNFRIVLDAIVFFSKNLYVF